MKKLLRKLFAKTVSPKTKAVGDRMIAALGEIVENTPGLVCRSTGSQLCNQTVVRNSDGSFLTFATVSIEIIGGPTVPESFVVYAYAERMSRSFDDTPLNIFVAPDSFIPGVRGKKINFAIVPWKVANGGNQKLVREIIESFATIKPGQVISGNELGLGECKIATA